MRFINAFIIGAVAVACLSGCVGEVKPEKVENFDSNKVNFSSGKYKEVVIEGCQYFQMPTSHSYYILTHKGNCNNPIHKGN